METRLSENWNRTAIPNRVKERAATRWTQDADCWISRYSVGSHGYAQIGWTEQGRAHMVLAHRASWEHTMGPVPLGHTLDHVCKNRLCVNPAHLRVLTNHENARRTNGRDWPLGYCVNGHSNEHLVTQPNGKRICRECNRIWQARYNAKRRRKTSAIREPV